MKVRHIFLSVLFAGVITACQKTAPNPTDDTIVILLEDASIGVDVDTKATPVTSIPSTLYWGATTGGNAAGSTSETVKWATASASVTNNMISTGKFLPASPSNCNYYVANQTFTAGGNMTVSNNSTDIICGRTFGTTLQMPTVVLNHIFARTGTLTLNVPSGYTATSVSWRIKSKGAVSGTAGTYNVRTQSWSAASSSLADQAFTASSDLWVIPGSYTVTITFTLTKGDFTKTYIQAGDVTLAAGKVNNITATCTMDEAALISFGVEICTWGNNSINIAQVEIEKPAPPTFGGLEIAPGPLYYDGTAFAMYDDWNHDSYNSAYGKTTGSTYFTSVQIGKYFDADGSSFDYSSGDIDNANTLNGWRVPTYAELLTLTTGDSPGTSRTGSTVNGTTGAKYAVIQLTGVTHAGSSTPAGLLLFPDGKTITGRTLSGINKKTVTTGVTNAELNVYLNQDCAFLPASGYYNVSTWSGGGARVYWWSATKYPDANFYYGIGFNSGSNVGFNAFSEYYRFPVRLVRLVTL